ncbi:MAG: nuclear transport factor 2 family protein [Phaeodactylibacter sp.]|uniref:nuclear transport factor 2 family protein n=1 Tax=Phaeodactylibacter sp. TaxID=1940289 RepID=UPI0032EB9136
MKKLLFCATLLGCTTLLQAQSPTDEAAMHSLTRQYMAAYNAGDHAALQEMYTDDAVRIDTEGKRIEGPESIAAALAEQLRANNATLLVRQNRLRWSDAEYAFVAEGTYEVYGTPNVYNIAIDVTGQYANTMLKEDGEWKIAKSVLMDPATENVAVIDGLYQAFAKGDIPAALEPMDADIVWNEAESFPYADKNPYVGPEAVLNGVFARIGAEWEYWNLTDIELHDVSGNKVLATLRYNAKHKATGKTIDSQTAHLWTLRDGKIIAFQQFTDTKQAAAAVR